MNKKYILFRSLAVQTLHFFLLVLIQVLKLTNPIIVERFEELQEINTCQTFFRITTGLFDLF